MRDDRDKPSPEWYHIRTALRVIRRLYGRTKAAEFGPLALTACQEQFLKRGQNRRTINQNVGRVKRMFRWAVKKELVPRDLYHGLQAVDGLKRGRTEARESEGVKPVPDAHVEAVLPKVSRQIAAMINLQLLTGMRPGEVVIMRVQDVNRSEPTWVYRPTTHKNTHRGHDRNVYLGPKAQKVVWPFLQGKEAGYLFSPREAEEERNAGKRAGKSKPSRRRGRKAPRWREHYDVASYRRAIRRGCELANVEPWSPHRLRHSAATRIRKEFGIEAARVILGHRSAAVTEIYAEIDQDKALEVVAEAG